MSLSIDAVFPNCRDNLLSPFSEWMLWVCVSNIGCVGICEVCLELFVIYRRFSLVVRIYRNLSIVIGSFHWLSEFITTFH